MCSLLTTALAARLVDGRDVHGSVDQPRRAIVAMHVHQHAGLHSNKKQKGYNKYTYIYRERKGERDTYMSYE